MSKGLRAVMVVSLVLNLVLVAGAVWVVSQVGARPLAEQTGVVDPRRPAYDVYAAERFEGLPGAHVAVVGDSHVDLGSWSELLGEPVAERGQGGATTAEIAAWADEVPAETGRTIVLAGSNDVLTGTPHDQLRADAVRLYSSLPGDVVALGVPPLAGLEDQATAANEVLQSAADEAGAVWVDPTGALSAPGLIRHDGVHLTGDGYQALAGELRTP